MECHILEDCGNSPKNKMLVDWTVAIVKGEADLPFVTKDSMIEFKGENQTFAQFDVPSNLDAIHLERSVTHGRDGALLGKAIKGTDSYPFALFFTFSLGKQPKIKTLKCIVDRI